MKTISTIYKKTKQNKTAEDCPKRLPLSTIIAAWLGATLATATLAIIDTSAHILMLLGSFGASCLLIFAYPRSPLAQPRNVIGGHVIATLTGLAFMTVFGVQWWSMATAVGTAIALMLLLRVPHPPAGSNPLIVMLGVVHWDFLITPTLLGAIVLVGVALVYNNIGDDKHYPTYWW